MTVYKVYWKIFRKNLTYFIIVFSVFLFFCFLFTMLSPEESYEFKETKTNITVISHDSDPELINGLTNYLSTYADFKYIEEEHIEDALYYREIFLAIIIPEGYTEKFRKGEEVKLIEHSVPDSPQIIAVKQAINKYLNTVRIYLENTKEPFTSILVNVKIDLENTISVETALSEADKAIDAVYYFNYLYYFFIIVIFTNVGVVMLSFRQKDIYQRNIVGPVSQIKLNLRLILSHFIFTFILFLFMTGFSYIFYYDSMSGKKGLFFILNAFCISSSILTMSYMLSLFIKQRSTLMAFINVLGLATSFIGGAFVPQWLLGENVLRFARIFPNYYYIANNNFIGLFGDLSTAAVSRIIFYMLIQILYAFVFIITAIFINKRQLTKET